jgi:hypothetical protein
MPSSPKEILATPAGAFKGWRLHARCAGCRFYAMIEIHRLPDHLHGLTLAAIIERLVCRRCGAREQSSVQLRHHMASTWLLGDASDL